MQNWMLTSIRAIARLEWKPTHGLPSLAQAASWRPLVRGYSYLRGPASSFLYIGTVLYGCLRRLAQQPVSLKSELNKVSEIKVVSAS